MVCLEEFFAQGDQEKLQGIPVPRCGEVVTAWLGKWMEVEGWGFYEILGFYEIWVCGWKWFLRFGDRSFDNI